MKSPSCKSIALGLLLGLCASGAHATSPNGQWQITITNRSAGQLPYLLTASTDDGSNLSDVNWDYGHYACVSPPNVSSGSLAPNASSDTISVTIGTGCDIDTGNVYYYNFLVANQTITLVTTKNSPTSVNMNVYANGVGICNTQIGDHSDDYAAITLTAGTNGSLSCTLPSQS
ncbi:hypothetical protein [Endothiovibrio diazotrophicus]